MAEHQGIRAGGHRVFVLNAHLVFATRYRYRVCTGAHLDRGEEIMRGVCAGFGVELGGVDGEGEHVHPLVNHPPTIAPSKPVNSLKGVSWRRVRREFPGVARRYHRANDLWPGSYVAGSARGAPIWVPRHYIERRNRPGRGTLGIIQRRDGRFAFVASEGEVVGGPLLQIGNTTSRVDFGRDPGEWVDDWSATGISHHWALSTGHRIADLRALADLMEVELVEVRR